VNEKDIDQQNLPEQDETTIHVNEYGSTKDPAVVVDEPNRTVLLTKDETIVVEKEPRIDVIPKNRPRKVYGGMWGQAELITLGLALFAVLAAVLLYIFVVMPSGRELDRNRADRDRLEQEMISAKAKYGDITSTETQVARLVSSVQAFETNFLPVPSTGRAALYQRINGLIGAYGLVNTTGPDYAPLETADQGDNNQSDVERGRAKYRSLFPGVYITMTVEGPYQNLRRFIREIETGSDFVAISAVELEPSDSDAQKPDANPAAPPQQNSTAVGNPKGSSYINNPNGIQEVVQQPQRPRGRTHGETVALRLEMAAYFRRPGVVPAVTTGQQ
jgi:hypothetical protein